MDSSSAGQERMEVNGRRLRPAVDINRLMMMMIYLFNFVTSWYSATAVARAYKILRTGTNSGAEKDL